MLWPIQPSDIFEKHREVRMEMQLLARPGATFVNNQPVQEITKQLVAARFEIRMVFLTEYRTQLRFRYPEIGECQYLDDVVVGEF